MREIRTVARRCDRSVEVDLEVVRDALVDAERIIRLPPQILPQLCPDQCPEQQADYDRKESTTGSPFAVRRVSLRAMGVSEWGGSVF